MVDKGIRAGIMADNISKHPLLSASSALLSYASSLRYFGGAIFLLGLRRHVSSFCAFFFLSVGNTIFVTKAMFIESARNLFKTKK